MKKVLVYRSPIHGTGLKAAENIHRGDTVFVFKGEPRFKINKNKRDALSHPNWVGVSKHVWLDPLKPYIFLNHSCDPNVGTKGRLTVVALRDIQAGEELTIDYSIIEGDPRWEMPCKCGVKNCRKVIRSVHFLPPRQFKKYLPYVPTYFKKLYLHKTNSVR